MLDRLEAADRATELHAVLRVLDREIEHFARSTQHLGGRVDRAAINQRVDGTRVAYQPTRCSVEVQPTQLASAIHRWFTRRASVLVKIDGEERRPVGTRRDHDRDRGRRRIGRGVGPPGEAPTGAVGRGAHAVGLTAPRDAPDALIGEQPTHQVGRAG